MDDRGNIGISEPFCGGKCVEVQRLIPNDIDIAFSGFGFNTAFFHQLEHAFNAHRKTAGRSVSASEHSDERVITAAAADRTLSAKLIGDPFENCEIVVVKTANQSRVHNIIDAFGFQNRF